MSTQLREFQNNEGDNLRWILNLPNNTANKVILCLHGFERCSSTEKKFKSLSDVLIKDNNATFRFDFSWCGLSDWEFRTTTIGKQADELQKAIELITKTMLSSKISIVAHSLGACVLAKKINEIRHKIDKIILIAPALNQKNLLRYWFVTWVLKKTHPSVEVTWFNFQQYLDEKAFQEDCCRSERTLKANFINSNYFLEGSTLDYSDRFEDMNESVLHIHGSKDVSVPLESVNFTFKNQIIIEGGDHDLEKPNQLSQWIDKAASFLR